MYAMQSTRPDFAYTMSALSRFNANSTTTYKGAAKRALRYMRSTTDYGITYSAQQEGEEQEDLVLTEYADSDWASDKDTRKSVTGYVFMLNGRPVLWKSC
jgi:hypothetical protein